MQLPDMDREDPLERGIQLDTAEGIKLLGSPIGSLSFELGLCTLYQIHKKNLGTS